MHHPFKQGAIFLLLVLLNASLATVLTVPARAQSNVRFEILLKEAETGNVEAQYMLGLSYASGIGTKKNPAEALKWYRKAADQGLLPAQKNLAQLLAAGKGVGRNYIEAYKWYEIALQNMPRGRGRDEISFERRNLANKIKPKDIVEAEKLAANWARKFRLGKGQTSSGSDASATASAKEKSWSCNKEAIKGPTSELWLNPCLLDLVRGKWIKIHQQKRGDAVRFRLQSHGGSAFDTRRGRVILFGSDTHDSIRTGNGELINSLLSFNLAKLWWIRFYPSDPLRTYTIHRLGVPVAGYAKNHPWAMHTYGAVEYDRRRDEIIVSSHPQHLDPLRFVRSVAHLWPYIKYHPTWIFSFRTNRWSALTTPPKSFFRYSTAYDSDRGVVIGFRGDGVFELSGRYRKWRQVSDKGVRGGHSNSVYDSKHKAVVVFGGGYDVGNSNDVTVFWTKTKRHRIMPTAGIRPRPDAHVPMAYHPIEERTVVLIDEDAYRLTTRLRQHSSAQTWLYDLEKDEWTKLVSARMPLGLGMNYNLLYDPGHNILVLVAQGEKNRTTVWALRL